MSRNLNYKDDLLDDLRNDLGFAAEYLSAAISDSREAFLVALRDVAEAQKGMSKVAIEANVNRENLYRMLSEEGNPRFSTLGSVLNALGMSLTVKPMGNSPVSAAPLGAMNTFGQAGSQTQGPIDNPADESTFLDTTQHEIGSLVLPLGGGEQRKCKTDVLLGNSQLAFAA